MKRGGTKPGAAREAVQYAREVMGFSRAERKVYAVAKLRSQGISIAHGEGRMSSWAWRRGNWRSEAGTRQHAAMRIAGREPRWCRLSGGRSWRGPRGCLRWWH